MLIPDGVIFSRPPSTTQPHPDPARTAHLVRPRRLPSDDANNEDQRPSGRRRRPLKPSTNVARLAPRTSQSVRDGAACAAAADVSFSGDLPGPVIGRGCAQRG
jgi:hypothetical protein